ncbi:uncharacterized protein BYT42DRAFT_557937 [Radiomyces spectabilis]|uniref:uncharacterized protein n=1 Tax=Radiomyces spectabilis TaxID=64574 RepID=UPI0022205445|nr:uncharacterized protein BYT42DRAFT_557937 [Radiomyces spectabilis]KAI8391748.1 hypothetical protein BYT42DRAFT_557937 [Radiomyces spectabilis]
MTHEHSLSPLLELPSELLLYILKNFLGLSDLWTLLQVSRALRYFAMDSIHKRWKIEISSSPGSTMKVQCRAALIALESLSGQLSLQTRVYSPYMFNNYFSSTVTADRRPTSVRMTSTATVGGGGSGGGGGGGGGTAGGILSSGTTTTTMATTMATTTATPSELFPLLTSTPPYDLEERLFDESTLHAATGSHTGENDENEFLLTTVTYDNKLFSDLMLREERLHQRIIEGISSYKHKYVLIEDIDTRNRIRTAVDVIFHHAVFIAAMSRTPVRLACIHACSNNRSLAAMMVRLLTRLDSAFPSYCREITYTLADNIKAFLEYTGYKLLAMSHYDHQSLYDHVFGPACPQHALCNNLQPSTTAMHGPFSSHSRPHSSSSPPSSSCRQPSLLLTLHSISACFDLMGAAFVGKILTESHVECAVQRTCELLSDDHLRSVKRALLVDLLEGWLTIKRGLVAGELCRLVRLEIEKCDRQAFNVRSSHSSSRTNSSNSSAL